MMKQLSNYTYIIRKIVMFITNKGDVSMITSLKIDLDIKKDPIGFVVGDHDKVTLSQNIPLYIPRLMSNIPSGEKKINSILARGDFEEGAFLLLDIDNFKSVNDKFGHQCGDTVLAEAACILKNVFRESDVLCRLGGDEFVVFMPFNNDGIFIESKIAQLLQAMKRQVSVGSDSVTISCSIGAARAPHNGTDFTKLYENADKALYKSKAKGRNSVTYC